MKMDENRNSSGIYDIPVSSPERQNIVLSRDELERQLDAGAFFMDCEEAARLGFIHPDHQPDTVCAGVRERS